MDRFQLESWVECRDHDVETSETQVAGSESPLSDQQWIQQDLSKDWRQTYVEVRQCVGCGTWFDLHLLSSDTVFCSY